MSKRKALKRPRATIVFLHGIGNKGESWEQVISQLPYDVTAITVDLLGFGYSPKPAWATYDVRTQARAVISTLIGLHIRGRVTVVGHSLGSLVAIEVARRYPVLVKSLLLCSPPLYDMDKDKIRLVGAAFGHIRRNPERFVKLIATAKKYKLINKTFSVTDENIHSYVNTLEASILTQTSLEDVSKLRKPVIMIHGSADPWVKKRNLVAVTRANRRAVLVTTQAGHEVRGLYTRVVVRTMHRNILNTPAPKERRSRIKKSRRSSISK